MEILLVYVTCPSQAVAETLGSSLVRSRLAACYNIWAMQSAYWWDQMLTQDQEWVLLMKTRPDLEEALESFILQHHPYQVPCVLRWKSSVNTSYGKWVFQETKSNE